MLNVTEMENTINGDVFINKRHLEKKAEEVFFERLDFCIVNDWNDVKELEHKSEELCTAEGMLDMMRELGLISHNFYGVAISSLLERQLRIARAIFVLECN